MARRAVSCKGLLFCEGCWCNCNRIWLRMSKSSQNVSTYPTWILLLKTWKYVKILLCAVGTLWAWLSALYFPLNTDSAQKLVQSHVYSAESSDAEIRANLSNDVMNDHIRPMTFDFWFPFCLPIRETTSPSMIMPLMRTGARRVYIQLSSRVHTVLSSKRISSHQTQRIKGHCFGRSTWSEWSSFGFLHALSFYVFQQQRCQGSDRNTEIMLWYGKGKGVMATCCTQ